LKEWPEEGPEMVWSYEGVGNGYGSPVVTSEEVFVNGELDSLSHLFAFDLDGKLLWKSEYDSSWVVRFPGSRSTPTVVDDLVYVCSPKGEIVCYKAEDGSKVTEVWRNNGVNSIQEGLLKVNDKLIGTHYKKFHLKVIDDKTGETTDSLKTGNASAIYADNMLYVYSDRDRMQLVKLDPELELVSTFKIKKGTKEHFAHPAIRDGKLYVCHGNALMAYNIKKESK
jgi:outer membrane protein assembly factor BamB